MRVNRTDKGEQGQAIVVMVLAMVALVGFAALALDGGNLYTEQRRAQAAADNAVMAAAYTEMRGGTHTNEALAAMAHANALINGYDDTSARSDVTFSRPPSQGPYSGNPEFMEVSITQRVPTALAHIIFGQTPIPLTVWAVAHGVAQLPVMDGYAITAMKRECDGESMISLQGRGGGSTGGTFLYGGGAFTNANCDDALTLSGSGEQLITDGAPISIAEGGNYSGGGIVSPEPTLGVAPATEDPLAATPAGVAPDTVDDDVCATARNINTELADGDGRIRPGFYTSLSTNGTSFIMDKGIYCLADGSLDPGNGSVTGTGVMIYLMNPDAEINFAGNGRVNLTAPSKESTGCVDNEDDRDVICRYLNIVVYKLNGNNQCQNNAEEIKFVGNGEMVVIGLVYAPHSMVRYGGSGSLLMTGQTIAGCVKFNGNGLIEIYYDPDQTYNPPPIIRLDE